MEGFHFTNTSTFLGSSDLRQFCNPTFKEGEEGVGGFV